MVEGSSQNIAKGPGVPEGEPKMEAVNGIWEDARQGEDKAVDLSLVLRTLAQHGLSEVRCSILAEFFEFL